MFHNKLKILPLFIPLFCSNYAVHITLVLDAKESVVRTTYSIIKSIRCSTWTPFLIRENMSEHLTLSVAENKLNELNKKIIEIKKKIQLSGNGSNCTKQPSLIYTVPDNPAQINATKLLYNKVAESDFTFIQGVLFLPLHFAIIEILMTECLKLIPFIFPIIKRCWDT